MLVITWKSVSIVVAALGAVLALVLAGHLELATVVGAMGTLLGGLLRQMVYKKPEEEPAPSSKEVDEVLTAYLRARTTRPPPEAGQ